MSASPSPLSTQPTMAAILRVNASVAAANASVQTTTLTLILAGNNNSTNLTLALDDEFAEDHLGYSDLHVAFLTCLFTAAPLLAVVLAVIGLRIAWRKYQGAEGDDEVDEMLRRTDTRQSMSQDQLKTSESQFTVLASDDVESGRYGNHAEGVTVSVVGVGAGSGPDCPGDGPDRPTLPPPHRQVQHNTMSSRSSNGSVITLTMHNNHLIVEKEEIVEQLEEQLDAECAGTTGLAGLSTLLDQKALVHEPPASAAAPLRRANTGLSQPDLSGGSEGENPAYSYGNQVGYGVGPMGYSTYNGYRPDDPPSRPRPVRTDVLRPRPLTVQDSVDDVQDLPEDCPQPQRLLSDIRAREDALQRQNEATLTLNGNAPQDGGGDADDGDDDSTSATDEAPAPTLSSEQALRPPSLEKLRLEDAPILAELQRFPPPGTSPAAASKTPPPPARSPLAGDAAP